MTTVLVIDGGQTSTRAALLLDGRKGGTWRGAPLAHPRQPGGRERLRQVLASACLWGRTQARAVGTAPTDLRVLAALSGLHPEDEDLRQELVALLSSHLELPSSAVAVLPDYVAAWWATTVGAPGILLIAGGGTVVYGRDAEGRDCRIGGWGHRLGDEGSAYWLGLEAVRHCLRAHDGLDQPGQLYGQVLSQLGRTSPREVADGIYGGEIADDQVAAVAPTVVALAKGGDPTCRRLLEEASRHLAEMVSAAVRQLGPLPVWLWGGVATSPSVRCLLSQLLPGLELRPTEGLDSWERLAAAAQQILGAHRSR